MNRNLFCTWNYSRSCSDSVRRTFEKGGINCSLSGMAIYIMCKSWVLKILSSISLTPKVLNEG